MAKLNAKKNNTTRTAANPPANSKNASPANRTAVNPPVNPINTSPASSNSSLTAKLKAYRVPIILFAASLYFQLFMLPRVFPTSHYDVLGIPRHSSVEEVNEAYEKLTEKWNSDINIPSTIDFIKVRYAFELLTNQFWKRDYDIFGIDEPHEVIESFKEQHAMKSISKIYLPILDVTSFDPADHGLDVINSENFKSRRNVYKALIIQVFSLGSPRCAEFLNNWKRIVNLLEGVANAGMVELGDTHLATYLAEKKSGGRPFFRNGLPALVAFPPECKSSGCLHRYSGELSVDAVTDWVATTIFSLPRIPYYSKETLGQKFLAKVGSHKVKVIFFSKTGERATPFIRQTARNYWSYANFAFVLWQEAESSLWWNMLGVESAPAIVFLKDPGVKPVVYHGSFNTSLLIDLIEENKYQVLPQLRSLTSMELGCDARGFSRAGNDSQIWYCAVLAGRQSQELNKMRETMRRVQEALSNDNDVDTVEQDPVSALAALALKQKRLTFTWLDGEAQKKYCFFHIQSENSYEACGPRRDVTDVPQLFIIRYERDASENVTESNKEPRNLIEALNRVEVDPASQLVAKYNGPNEIPEIIRWVSGIIRDGDSRKLPSFKTKSPELVPEDADPIWSRGSEKIISTSRGMKQLINGVMNSIYDHLCDPKIGPFLLLGALMSSARVWLHRNQPTDTSSSNNSSQQEAKNVFRPKRKTGPGSGADQLIPPSIIDLEPEDATQMEFSDSDS